MLKTNSDILKKFFWQIILLLGIIMSANAEAVQDDPSISIFEAQSQKFSTFFTDQESDNQSPISDFPEDESSSQKNGEEENEENSDTDYDGEFSNNQIEDLIDPYLNSFDATFYGVVAKSYKIPLYILFHCWKDYLV